MVKVKYSNNMNTIEVRYKARVKKSYNRPGDTLRVTGGRGSQISGQSAHEGGRVVSPSTGRLYPPRNIPGTYFC
jgi:hypothetical protein